MPYSYKLNVFLTQTDVVELFLKVAHPPPPEIAKFPRGGDSPQVGDHCHKDTVNGLIQKSTNLQELLIIKNTVCIFQRFLWRKWLLWTEKDYVTGAKNPYMEMGSYILLLVNSTVLALLLYI